MKKLIKTFKIFNENMEHLSNEFSEDDLDMLNNELEYKSGMDNVSIEDILLSISDKYLADGAYKPNINNYILKQSDVNIKGNGVYIFKSDVDVNKNTFLYFLFRKIADYK